MSSSFSELGFPLKMHLRSLCYFTVCYLYIVSHHARINLQIYFMLKEGKKV